MTTPERRLFHFMIGSIVAAAILVALVILAFRYLDYVVEQEARNRIREQIAEVKTGKRSVIRLSSEIGEFEFSEFAKSHEALGQGNPYELQIGYSENVDDFLRQIEGATGVHSLVLYKTDVSDSGMESIATMPDLRQVAFEDNHRTAVTNGKLEELRARIPQCTIQLMIPDGGAKELESDQQNP